MYTASRILVHINILIILMFYLSTSAIADNDRNSTKQSCLSVAPAEDTYLDNTHSQLTVWFCEPASWFDNFFVDDRSYEEGQAGTRLRWRNDIVFTEDGSPGYITNIRISIRLPGISNRLKLVFDGEDEDELNDVIPSNIDNAQNSLSFLYDFLDSQKANLSLRIRSKPSITLRYRFTHPVNDDLITRFTQNIYREEGEFGTNTVFDVDKTIDGNNAIRWSNKAEIIEDKDGLEWFSAFVLFHRINDKSALSYESGVSGETRPFDLTNNYRLGIRYRKNFYRKWLFYELAPEVTWPKKLITDIRHSVFAFTMRLEIYFENQK